MEKSVLVWILIAFVFYLLVMLAIGVIYMKRTNNTEDFFLDNMK